MAQADVLTASLRANPIFYADSQLIPFGHYSNNRPGGQTQYDVNVTIPLDVTRKRIAGRSWRKKPRAPSRRSSPTRSVSAWTIFTPRTSTWSGRHQTLILSKQSRTSLAEQVAIQQNLLKGGEVPKPLVEALEAQLDQIDMQIAEAGTQLERSKRALGNLLVMSPAEIKRLDTRASLEQFPSLPQPPEELARMALVNRPDLLAMRRGVALADAGVNSARANVIPMFTCSFNRTHFRTTRRSASKARRPTPSA